MDRPGRRVATAYGPVEAALEAGLDRPQPLVTCLLWADHEKVKRLLAELHMIGGEGVALEEPRPDVGLNHGQPRLERQEVGPGPGGARRPRPHGQ